MSLKCNVFYHHFIHYGPFGLKLQVSLNILFQVIYSRTLIIRTPVCHFNINSVQINEFVRISELSDKIHYLAS